MSLSDRYAEFLKKFPEYAETNHIDELRKKEYSRLDASGQVYLDYTGGGLYAESQLAVHSDLLKSAVFGNPHSTNPSSQAATRLVEETRRSILEFFNASPEEYEVIFTGNSSGALKLVGESYPFSGGKYLLTFDNHNSVNGIREFARMHGADVTYLPVTPPDLRVREERLISELAADCPGRKLFAYPAQSNFSSVQHPLEWIEYAHQRGWDVLLDAAAFVPTNRLDLGKWKPDFVPISFYKMFGYPTGIGALIARKTALTILRRPWFAGGTITVASVQGDTYYLDKGAAGFEDGTLNYLGIPAIKIGLDYLRSVGVDIVHSRVLALTGWLLDGILKMKHATEKPLARVYGPSDLSARGGAVTLNYFDASGAAIDHRRVEAEANKVGISIRTGCFCNPGAGEVALDISREELITCFSGSSHESAFTVDDLKGCLHGKSNGAVRISVGIASDFKDVERFLEFSRGFLET